MPQRSKSVKDFQDGSQPKIDGQDPVDPTDEKPEVDERAVLLVFDDHNVVEQFVTLVGASGLKLPEKLEHGDEVALEITGKVQKGEIITRERERRHGGRKETVIVRKVKVDGVKLIRATHQML